MNEDVTHITHDKVSAHVKTSGWGNRYLIVLCCSAVPWKPSVFNQQQRGKTRSG